MKRRYLGFDHRVRICGKCHSWFLSEGAHSRLCTLCCAEVKRAMERSWESSQSEVIDRDHMAMTTSAPVTG